jgi:hypothetical protein
MAIERSLVYRKRLDFLLTIANILQWNDWGGGKLWRAIAI